FDVGVDTADAFRWWDEDGAPRDGRDDAWANDLGTPVIARHPRVADAMRLLLDGGATRAVMSGSGPSVVGLRGADRPFAGGARDGLRAVSGREPVDVRPWRE